MFDPKCYELAVAFLQDEPELAGEGNKLAQAIQDAIEGWIAEQILERRPPPTIAELRRRTPPPARPLPMPPTRPLPMPLAGERSAALKAELIKAVCGDGGSVGI